MGGLKMTWKTAIPKVSKKVGAFLSISNVRIYLNAAMVNLLRDEVNEGADFDALKIEYDWDDELRRTNRIKIKPGRSDVDADTWPCPSQKPGKRGARNYRAVNSRELCRDILQITWGSPKQFKPVNVDKKGVTFDLTEAN